MDYIKVEEFLKQSKKVQENLLNWWKENVKQYNLFYRKFRGERQKYIVTKVKGYELETITLRNREISAGRDAWTEKWNIEYIWDIIPLLTETQLRKFIEDKTGRKVQTTVRPSNKYFIDLIGKRYYDEDINITTNKKDVLRAYWQVACKIVEGEKNNE